MHIPFCSRKCPYCDFNSYGIASLDNNATGNRRSLPTVPEARYTASLISELRKYAADPAWQNRSCRSLFFGGGTPSLFSAESIGQVIAAAKLCFSFSQDVEITLEANPGTIHEELSTNRLEGYLQSGVNRISIGAQSFNSQKLTFLGRIHQVEHTELAIRNVRSAGFDNLNLDLIFGTADESLDDWNEDLERALELAPEHISAYSLIIEPGTEFGRVASRGATLQADDELVAEMYQLSQAMLGSNGYPQYEISNFARPTKRCSHNEGYWFGYDYLGLGAGAHSFYHTLPGKRWSNIPGPLHYMDRIETEGEAIQLSEALTPELARLEFFTLRLRHVAGINFEEYKLLFGEPFLPRYQPSIDLLQAQQLVEQKSPDQLNLTRRGMLFANTAISEFSSC